MVKYVIATATNSQFYVQTQQMLYSLHCLLPDGFEVLIFDNGLTAQQSAILQSSFGFAHISVFKRQLTTYDRQSYLFKTWAHELALQMGDCIYMWLDSKTMLKYDENKILRMLEKQPVYGHMPFPQPEHYWTDIRTMDAIELDEVDRQTPQIQASAMLFDLRTNEAKAFLSTLIYLNRQKEIITPEGTFKGFEPPTHRQDQSVFSCLMKKSGYKDNDHLWAMMHCSLYFN